MSTTTQMPRTTIVTPEDVTVINAFGNPVAITLRSQNTGGHFAMLEFTLAPGSAGPPPHTHETFDEIYHVLDGAISMLVDGEPQRVSAGSSIFIPRGTVHTPANPYDAAAHFIFIVSPAGFEHYFEEVAAAAEAAGGQITPDIIFGIMRRYDVVIAETG